MASNIESNRKKKDMNQILQFLENTFEPLVFIFTVSNLAIMGLQAKMPELIAGLKNKKALVLIFVWGWVLGPAIGLLTAWILPLSEPFVIGLLLCSLAPCAPFLPLMVTKADGDMNFASALFPLVAIGTIIFMPLLAPFLIKGVTLSVGALVKLFLLSMLIPLMIGLALKHYMETVSNKIFPLVNLIAKLSALATIIWSFALYSPEMLATVGSFGLLSMTIFMVIIGWITYRIGFGMKQNQRSVMSLGMLTRNGAVVLLAAMTVPDLDPLVITYIIMFILWSFVIAAIAARIFGKQAFKSVAQNST